MASSWHVYVLRCADGTLYTGITTDVERRIDEHNEGGPKAARYTRARRPVALVHREPCADRSEASRREAELKRLSRNEKIELVGAAHGRRRRHA